MKFWNLLLSCILSSQVTVNAADTASQAKTTGAKSVSTAEDEWPLVFEDDFEGRTEVGENYTAGHGHEKGWSVKDGVLVGQQVRDDHGTVIRKELDFDDADIQFDFRFNGGKSFNFVIDDKKEKSVHAGHICRVSVFRKSLRIGDDKTGSMNLEVRKKRKNKNLSATDAKAVDALIKSTQSSAKTDIKPGKWHTLRVRIEGDTMEAYLDGKLSTSLRSPGFDHPTKTKFGFTVNGSSIDFDNVKVRLPR